MINMDYKYSIHCPTYDKLIIQKGSVYLYQKGREPRSKCVETIKGRFGDDVKFVEVAPLIERDVNTGLAGDIRECTSDLTYNLHSMEDLDRLLRVQEIENIYLDASGLSIRILAPLIKRSLELFRGGQIDGGVYIVYAEPMYYDVKKFSEEGEYFDLSEKIEGIRPLPGYERIIPRRKGVVVVPLLGFEGGRLAHILSSFRDETIEAIPIVGVPGYRPEYPFATYYGNRRALQDLAVYPNVRFAAAGSVVDAFFKLVRLKEDKNRVDNFVVAPIGTKPHTIAALLFCCCYPRNVEIAYDNPIRNKVRTVGVGRLTVTCVTDMIMSNYEA